MAFAFTVGRGMVYPAPRQRGFRMTAMRSTAIFFALAVLGGGCDRLNGDAEPPPRATDKIVYQPEASTFGVPVTLSLSTLRTAIEREIPKNLYSLNRHVSRCVPSQKVRIFKENIPFTPKLACDVTIRVTRGPIRLKGQGRDIVAIVPIKAWAKAANVAGVLYETANGEATARVVLRLDVTRDWHLSGKARLAYDWTTPPGVRLLGRRFTFTDEVDRALGPVIAGLQRKLPQELDKVRLKPAVADLWQKAFTVLELNRKNPPVWMRVTPAKLMFGGYSVRGDSLDLNLGIEGATETFVGRKPEPNPATPLPALAALTVPPGKASLFVPVVADYAEIEPVILEALVKRSLRSFDIPKLGMVTARFEKVTAYATTGGKVAVGIGLKAWRDARKDRVLTGTIWLTGTAVNPENTRTILFRDVAVTGMTDRTTGNLLLNIANHPSVAATIAEALTQHLDKDFNELRGKIDRAVAERHEGPFTIKANIDELRSGSLKATGEGLFLPVWARGKTSIRYTTG